MCPQVAYMAYSILTDVDVGSTVIAPRNGIELDFLESITIDIARMDIIQEGD